ncbi:MAG: hypothetical protein ACR2QM_14935 [Longimicrobiales bacterium]
MGKVVRVGDITWHWASNLVCAGPEERLIVVRAPVQTSGDPLGALRDADKMEWRDAGFRKWRVHRSPEGISFASHYERVGPTPLEPGEPLAGMGNDRLEELLGLARREGTPGRPWT